LVVELPEELPLLGGVVLDESLGEVLLGELLELELPLPLMPEEELPPEDVLPEAPLAPELEPDLSKCASHSERDTCPSPFLSTDEKLGDDELLEVSPADEDGVLDEDEGLLDDEEDCATARVDSANSTAAVVMLRVLGMDQAPVEVSRTAHTDVQALCQRARAATRLVESRPVSSFHKSFIS
jgi:hypothetical protein